MSLIDSVANGIGSVLKIMIENLGTLAGCTLLQEVKSPASEDEYIDTEKICANLEDRFLISSSDNEEISSLVKYCRKSCEPEMRAVPLIVTPPPQLTTPPVKVAVESPKKAAPPADMLTASLLPPSPSKPSGTTVPMEMNVGLGIAIPAWHVDPYSLEYRGDPYGDTDESDIDESDAPADKPKTNPASVYDDDNPYADPPYGETNKADPYAPSARGSAPESSEPPTTVKSSFVAGAIEMIRLGTAPASGEAPETKVVYKPFFTHYQMALCSCYDRRSTDTKAEFQTCLLEANRYK